MKFIKTFVCLMSLLSSLTTSVIAKDKENILVNTISGPLEYIPQPFDVLRYDAILDFTKAPSKNMSGYCQLTVLWKENPDTDKFFFHLRDLAIDSVFYENKRVTPEEKENKSSATYHWEITPPSGVRKDTVKIAIYYHGTMTAETGPTPWGGVLSQDNILFSMGVGFMNNYVSATQHWLPCYDLPSDKAAFDISFIVRAGKTVAATGNLVRHEQLDNINDIFEYRTDYPCATYLFCFAVADYQKFIIQESNPPVVVYSLPADSMASKFGYSLVPQMISAFEEKFIKYPFEKAGYVNTSIGSMEHQTMVSFDVRYLRGVAQKKDSMNLVAAHELAHQWFGDFLSCRDFRDAWLSEGFATYLESIWLEQKKGFNEYLNHQSDKINSYIFEDMSGEGIFPMFNYPRAYPSSNYPNTIYHKGCGVLGLLRYELGDSLFFISMKAYLNKYAYSTVTSDIFQKTFEDESGEKLGWFFEQWVYGKGLPQLDIYINRIPLGVPNLNRVTVRINQVQPDSFGLYQKLPVEISFLLKGSTYLHKMLILNEKSQTFQIDSVPDFITVLINRGPTVRSLFEVKKLTTSVEDARDVSGIDLKINPNPADSNVLILFNSQIQQIVKINIIDIKGNVVLKDKIAAEKGENRYSIDMSANASGVYVVQLECGDITNSKEIVICH